MKNKNSLKHLQCCKYCGHIVHVRANRCPSCGGKRPVKSAENTLNEISSGLFGCGCLLMLIGLLILSPFFIAFVAAAASAVSP